MIKSIYEKEEKRIEIDLTGPNGNAFALMGIARNIAKQLDRAGANDVEIDVIIKDMMSGDYEHLLEVFEKHFGDLVIMYR
jgi:hypothetical protein